MRMQSWFANGIPFNFAIADPGELHADLINEPRLHIHGSDAARCNSMAGRSSRRPQASESEFPSASKKIRELALPPEAPEAGRESDPRSKAIQVDPTL
ncbi:hypothetical protein CNMCM5793_002172 [Aspergillus hiratsukae]|uniref:Uncharacterized protein n=1 Tax=Aspergillus hiratsukae TaxID=1194566 RepID=A0A8H6P211_9EURO|nr:hypothetical protein CNMCM5793_002172 [Aspergillus hiratsukae]KAF7168287.1 hypothetical protein CNMCM6106_003528 [Aspergillus hiratsukae]